MLKLTAHSEWLITTFRPVFVCFHSKFSLFCSFRRDPNTIFRGNSLTSKCIDETMKLAGMHYLQVTLKPIIDEVWHFDVNTFFISPSYVWKISHEIIIARFSNSPQICTEHKPCEIDPVKLKESENLETNRVRRRNQRSLLVCAGACFLTLALHTSGKPSSLCRPHLQRYHNLWCSLSHRHVWYLLLSARVCCHSFPR